jgi:hypothetical protein
MKVIDPGHTYELTNAVDHTKNTTLRFLKKEPKANNPDELKLIHDGITTEEVLGAVSDRVNHLHSMLPDEYTRTAIFHVGQAIAVLNERTNQRKKRGVEGTPKA